MGYKNNHQRFWKRFTSSFVYAWSGIKYVILHEQNMKIHLCVGAITLLLAYFLNLTKNEMLIILVVIGIVLALEVMNTAIERVVDLVTEEKFHPIAKIVKDVSAGAVLMFSFFALVIGIIIFYRPLLEFLTFN